LVIFFLRVIYDTVDVLRMISVVKGKRSLASVAAFVQGILFMSVICQFLGCPVNPYYILSYALGWAIGEFVGVTLISHFGGHAAHHPHRKRLGV
jgi:uncharacterized protein YebE (UPF0316 family)